MLVVSGANESLRPIVSDQPPNRERIRVPFKTLGEGDVLGA
jgi:hypothetical protein